jgi:nucleoside-diphosphate-sugar epimerase
MRALVTGGCGFIGSNLTKKLVNLGWRVDVVDDLSNGDIDNISSIDIRVITPGLLARYDSSKDSNKTLVITGDFAAPQILSRIAEKKYDIIFHLAALPRVEYSVKNPVVTTEQNVTKSVLLMTACIDNVKRFVFSSSSAIYGNSLDNFPSIESGETNPESPYALQKRIVEDYCSLYSKLYDLDSVCLRYFNAYGPGQLGDSPYSTAISAWMDKIKRLQPLRSDGDGEQTRDMVYVGDIVDSNIIASLNKAKFSGDIFNIGTGKSYSNNDILDLLRERFEIKIINAPERVGDVRHTRAEISKSREILGFTSKVDLREGLDKTIAWWSTNEE